MMRRRSGAKIAPVTPSSDGDTESQDHGLGGDFTGGFAILFADAAGYRGRGRDAEAQGYGVQKGQQRFGEAYRGYGVGAQVRDPEDVHHGEEGLHHHLQHHGNGEQSYGAADGAGGEVAVRVAQYCVAEGLEKTRLGFGD